MWSLVDGQSFCGSPHQWAAARSVRPLRDACVCCVCVVVRLCARIISVLQRATGPPWQGVQWNRPCALNEIGCPRRCHTFADAQERGGGGGGGGRPSRRGNGREPQRNATALAYTHHHSLAAAKCATTQLVARSTIPKQQSCGQQEPERQIRWHWGLGWGDSGTEHLF